jgi:hypothetical protein
MVMSLSSELVGHMVRQGMYPRRCAPLNCTKRADDIYTCVRQLVSTMRAAGVESSFYLGSFRFVGT